MNLKKVLSPESVIMHLDAQSKPELLEEMVGYLAAQGKVADREAVLAALTERESKMSTGMQSGIAVPHAKTDAMREMVALVGLKKEGLDFDALDGQPCNIFVMTLSPAKKSGPHIQFLAEVSRLLSQPAVRDKILKAATAQEVYQLLIS